MRLLVLGGTSFVGHAVVAEGLARGWDVTVANRGVTGPAQDGVCAVVLDRTVLGAFAALAGERFDLVVDTWSLAPRVVRDAARALATWCRERTVGLPPSVITMSVTSIRPFGPRFVARAGLSTNTGSASIDSIRGVLVSRLTSASPASSPSWPR